MISDAGMRWGGHEEDAAGCSLSTPNLPSGLIPPLADGMPATSSWATAAYHRTV